MTARFEPIHDAQRDDLVQFMFAHAPIMMFPLTNLKLYGLGGEHPRSISAWVLRNGDVLTDVLTISREGMVFPCCPNAPWDAARQLLRQRAVKGLLGEGRQVAQIRAATGLTAPAQMDATEPAYVLFLHDLVVPDAQGFDLRPYGDADRNLLEAWRMAYEIETLNIPADQAKVTANHHVQAAIDRDSHRILYRDGTPVAVTGFNAALPTMVQIGGVFTPPDLRGNGYAKVALALHLLEAQRAGVEGAVLSAANTSAAKVYEALGFQRNGDFALVIYDTPQVACG
ncbi:MAG: GNAT family N-acetyltransferase [Pseudomonadota bacterium]